VRRRRARLPILTWASLTGRVGHLVGSRRWRVARNGVCAGLVAGSVGCAYRWMIALGTDGARAAYAGLVDHPWWLPLWLIAVLAVSCGGWWLMSWEPSAGGSGIPQVKAILQGRLEIRPVRVIVARFAGGAAGALAGLSLGREGPSIHLGAAISRLLAVPLRATPEETDHLVTAGAAAGLSAAFNAPVSGLMFAVEGLHRSFSPLVVASAATAALTADAVATLAFGPRPILEFGAVPELPLRLLWVVLPLGCLAGLLGAWLNRILLASHALTRLWGPLPILVAVLAALACGLLLPAVLGGGEELIGWAEYAATGLGAVVVLLVVKVALTAVSFGSGLPGGIFMPILAVGTLAGGAYALAVQPAGLAPEYRVILAVCGMAGVLAASVRTPLTSILLTAEMTGSLGHLLPVATVVVIAVFTADALRVPPIYDALLARSLGEPGVGGSPLGRPGPGLSSG